MDASVLKFSQSQDDHDVFAILHRSMITAHYKTYVSISSDDDRMRYILGKKRPYLLKQSELCQ